MKRWKLAEDVKILQYFIDHESPDWEQIALYLPERTEEQCRDRWYQKLDPDSKVEWTKEEEWIVFLKRREIERKKG